MQERQPHDRGPFEFPMPRMLRLPGPLGCLLMLLALPLLVIAAIGLFVWSLFRGPRVPATGVGPARGVPRSPSADETALCSLLEKLAMDETFSADDARQCGVDAAATKTVDELLEVAVARGWVERRGDGYAVTERGRNEAGGYLARLAR